MKSIKKIIKPFLPQNLQDWYIASQVKDSFDEYRYSKEENNLLKAFDEHQVIFIHIPKTAGISVRDSLFETHGFGKHVKAQTFKYYLGRKDFNRYFKFAFVRNPWARTLSAYNFLKKGGINKIDAEFAKNKLSKYPNFEEFIMNGLDQPEIINWVHFIPQYKWICNPQHKNLMDFTGRLENIEEDYEYIRKKTGLGKPLVHKNKGGSVKSYREHYTPEMRDKIALVYMLDIELFNYTF